MMLGHPPEVMNATFAECREEYAKARGLSRPKDATPTMTRYSNNDSPQSTPIRTDWLTLPEKVVKAAMVVIASPCLYDQHD